MKKLITLVLLALFLFSLSAPAVAVGPQTLVSRDKALEIAQNAVEIPDDLKLNNVSFRYDEIGGQVWSFNWSSSNTKVSSNITVDIDAVSGRVRNMYRYSPDYYGKNNYTVEEAKAIAEEFVKQMNPAEYDQLKMEPPVFPGAGMPEIKMPAQSEYQFRFNRVVNGYPYWDNGVFVNVSAANGKVMSYTFNWDAGELPSVENVVYKKQAKKIFLDKVGFDLNYLRIYKDGGPAEVALGYSLKTPYVQMYVDAVTGELIDYAGKPVDFSTVTNEPIGAATEPAPPNQLLSMDEAMELAKNWADLPEATKLNGVNYYEAQDGIAPPVWNFSWVDKSKPNYTYINVGINARTGEVVNIDTGYDPANQVTGIDEQQAKDVAIDFLKKVAPSRVGQLRLDPQQYFGDYNPARDALVPMYSFHFSRLVDGVPFTENGVNVSVNGKGKVFSYYANWEDHKFPSQDDLVSVEKAGSILTGQMGFDIGYARISDPQQDSKIRLVYKINAGDFYVDAKTGDLKNRWDGPIYYNKAQFNDVAGHWAEKDILKLAQSKILDAGPDNSYKPDAKASRGEITAMLARTLDLNSYIPDKAAFTDVSLSNKDFGYIEAAFKAGIVTGYNGKFNPDKSITKEEFAVMVIKGLDGAATGDAKLDTFKDAAKISAWASDAVVKAVGLGLFKGDNNGNFNPQQNVTKAEAAALLARVLELNNK